MSEEDPKQPTEAAPKKKRPPSGKKPAGKVPKGKGTPGKKPRPKKPSSNKKTKALVMALAGFIVFIAAGTAFYFNSKDSDEQPVVEEVVSTVPPDIQSMVDVGNLKGAADLIKNAVLGDPENIELISLAAWINYKLERHGEMLKMAGKLKEVAPELGLPYALEGVGHFGSHGFEKALKLSLKAIKLSPDLSIPYLTIGEIYVRQGKTADAIEVLKEGTRHAPKDPDAWTKLGSAYIKAQDYNRALIACKAAIDLDPKNAGAHFNLGQIYFRKEDATLSLRHVQIAEDLYRELGATRWVAKTRHNKDLYIKKFKLRPEDVSGS